MRAELCAALVARADRPEMMFLTGDLGFMALEPLRDRLGDRFLNCGISEQNMIGVAAGLAREGLEPWGLFDCAVLLCARLRADPKRYLPTPIASPSARKWRRLWLWRDGRDPSRAGGLRRLIDPSRHDGLRPRLQ